MKQHITPEQLDELTEEQREELGKWLDNHPDYSCEWKWAEELSIGQMIEFLDEQGEYPGQWVDNFVDWSMEDTKNTDRVCDALWEAVKEVL